EATAPTLGLARAWRKPFAFVLNQTPIRGQRIGNATAALGGAAALDLSDVLAQPFIVMRNDHQDALGAGLAVTEYAPAGKSAEEIRGLWRWVESRLNAGATAEEQPVIDELPVSIEIVSAMYLRAPARTEALVS